MAEALALSRCWEIVKIGEILAFPGSISVNAAKQLSRAADELFRDVFILLENLVASVTEKNTAADFYAARQAVYPKYSDAVVALASLTHLLVPKAVIRQLNQELFGDLEAVLKDRGLAYFGKAVCDQAIFSVGLLRRFSDLAWEMSEISLVDEGQEAALPELVDPCIHHAIHTRFHINCLVMYMQKQQPTHPDVLELVLDGLRSVAGAYGFARRVLGILAPFVPAQLGGVECDEEDTELLAEATYDLGDAAS